MVPKGPGFGGSIGNYLLRTTQAGDKLFMLMKCMPLWTSLTAAVLAVQMSGRILTPNGDTINDSVGFSIPEFASGTPRAEVYNLRGQRVARLSPVSPTELRWDGHDAAGRAVESGVYLVQISEDAALWSGVVAVAR